ncbi:tyrosine-type recombinase/integrase [Kaistia adipata]|uniref:tyrosine-type recombinase/integrase n=1 Tax=Kaistia adipata TaxID=166954 RepID=UPI00040B1295|nr:site-specific integrase [Kaistia adipata]
MPRRLPPGCVEDRDRYKNIRIYLRRPGRPKVRLLGTPWSTEFMDAYHAALRDEAPNDERRLKRSESGSWRWVCERYFAEYAPYLRMTPPTRAAYRRVLEATFDEPIAPGDSRCFRDVPISRMTPKAVRVLRDRKLATPAAANAVIKIMRQVFEFAIEQEMITESAAAKVELFSAATDGHHAWTVAEALQFEARHPIGTQARLAYALLLYTGARVSDVRLFGRQHVNDGWLDFKPAKTSRSSGIEVSVPVLPDLQKVLDACKQDNLTFLMTHQHKPYSAKGLSNRMRDWCDEAGLPQCSAHGLRKAGATIAAENGATESQLMAIFGWTSAKQASHYTKRANRKKQAGKAMALIKVG